MSKSWFNVWNYFFGEPTEEEKTITNEKTSEIVENSQISDSSVQLNQENLNNETENKQETQSIVNYEIKPNLRTNSPTDSKENLETENEIPQQILPSNMEEEFNYIDTSIDTSLLSEPDLSPEMTIVNETKKRKNEFSEETIKKIKLTPKIMFTGIVNESKLKKYQNMVTKLNGINSDDINEITHLITDKVHRTKKFLCALNQSHIVSLQWVLVILLNFQLIDSHKKKQFMNEEDYILIDKKAERESAFSMIEVLNKRKKLQEQNLKIFTGISFWIAPELLKPSKEDLVEIIQSGGGKIVENCSEDCFIISNENENKSERFEGRNVYGIEFVFSSIMNQENCFFN
jgi:hypothetical protein